MSESEGYNERLFSGGLRSRLHLGRFHWLAQRVRRHVPQASAVVELGCFDGKLIEFLPRRPAYYLGLDANWEGGLDLARERWQDQPQFEFRFCDRPEAMALNEQRFDIAVAMETLEHVPPEMVLPYLEGLASATDGLVFLTVPNEIGPVFMAKHIAKKLIVGNADPYTFREFCWQTLGRSDRVARREHKGFDYRRFLAELAPRFEVLEVSGYPLGFLPPYLNFGVGMVLRRRP